MKPIKTLFQSKLAQEVLKPFRGLGSITMYHRVLAERQTPSDFAPNFHLGVDAQQFDVQIGHLAKHYHCVHLEDLLQGQSKDYRVAVTFDDGHLDNLTLALPILEKHQVPATVFISTSFMEDPSVVWWYPLETLIAQKQSVVLKGHFPEDAWPTATPTQKQMCFNQIADLIKSMDAEEKRKLLETLLQSNQMGAPQDHVQALSWSDVKTLANHPLITIGAHTQNHPVLSTIPANRLHEEITRSKFILEDRLGMEVRTFAYPFGEWKHAQQREYDFAKNSGFDLAVTTRFGHVYSPMLQSDSRWCLPRVAIDPYDDGAKMDWKLGGSGALTKTAQRFIYERQPDSKPF